MHVHLDVIGGIAGDMFCSAMLDAFPELESPLQTFLATLPLYQSYSFKLNEKKQKEILGKQFIICKNDQALQDQNHLVFTVYTPSKSATIAKKLISQEHHHYTWQSIQQKLQQISHCPDIYQIACGVYSLLAKAESEIHGMALADLCLHEVGADDALLDIISAAFLIHHSQICTWSCSALPWGNGIVNCAHGALPVPAPATLKILQGFRWSQDDEMGERITPTGAAILAWLINNHGAQLSGSLTRHGYGCGQRQFKHKPNILRANVFETKTNTVIQDTVMVIQCDIDDMTAENLAIAQEKIRSQQGVIDLTSQQFMGKKGRWSTRFELLCKPEQLEAVCQSILLETSTLGVRFWRTERIKVVREHINIDAQNQQWPLKIAKRPDNSVTVKLEADTVKSLNTSYGERQRLIADIEQQALDQYIRSSTGENHE